MAAKKTNQHIDALIRGDQAGIRNIYREFAPRIEVMVRKNSGTADDARDVFQDALIIIWNKAQQSEFELTSSFYTYLHGICRFTWDRKRRKKANQTVTIDKVKGYTEDPPLFKDLESAERQRLFAKHFMELGETCQRILRLFFQKKPMQQIAELLGIKNEHAARNRKHRCQKKLEEKIINDPLYDEL